MTPPALNVPPGRAGRMRIDLEEATALFQSRSGVYIDYSIQRYIEQWKASFHERVAAARKALEAGPEALAAYLDQDDNLLEPGGD